MPITHERGYVIPAFDTEDVDYVSCARQLEASIKEWHPDAHVTILENKDLRFGDAGGQANDWQVYSLSPYRQTIKLEADMYCAGPIDHWWTLFENRDVVISQGCRDFYNRRGQSRRYRKIFDRNGLPDVYNAITYWRVSQTAQEFFRLVREIFSNWNSFRTLLVQPDDHPSTDLVYAMAAQILGPETVTLPPSLGPSIVHMKKGIVSLTGEDWTKELVWEHTDPGLRINTVAQQGLVHYVNKRWRV